MNRPAFALVLLAPTLGVAVAASAGAGEVRIPREQGDLIVRSSGETSYRPSGPAPAFADLDRDGNGAIDESEAAGYTLLANDFIIADGNRDGRVSQREYSRWAGRP